MVFLWFSHDRLYIPLRFIRFHHNIIFHRWYHHENHGASPIIHPIMSRLHSNKGCYTCHLYPSYTSLYTYICIYIYIYIQKYCWLLDPPRYSHYTPIILGSITSGNQTSVYSLAMFHYRRVFPFSNTPRSPKCQVCRQREFDLSRRQTELTMTRGCIMT